MDAIIALPTEGRIEVFEAAEEKLGLSSIAIEKDLWVCWTLRELFNLPKWRGNLSFKGGTSLSKGWGLIKRFSEDLDVVVSRKFLGFDDNLSKKQLKKLVKACSASIHEELLPALTEHMQTTLPKELEWQLVPASKDDDPDEQTLLFQYPAILNVGSPASYIAQVVRIEMGARSAIEPAETPTIQPYVCAAVPKLAGNGKFTIRTVVPQRTFLDKISLLHEENYRPAGKVTHKPRQARHYYDVWALIKSGIAERAMSEEGLFRSVVEHRRDVFGHSWMDYTTLQPGSLRLLPSKEREGDWRADYGAMAEMFFDKPPSFDDVLAVVGEFEKHVNKA